MHAKTLVVKFGSSVLRSPQCLPTVAESIATWIHSGHKVIAVVSAFDGVTDRLIQRATVAGLSRSDAAFAQLIGSGETQSADALTNVLRANGLRAAMVHPSDMAFVADGPRDDADPVRLNADELRYRLRENAAIIVPGFFATDTCGDTVLLGRGGSDISAIFIGYSLGINKVRLVKDVPALFDRDPNVYSDAKRLDDVSWSAALRVCGSLIQHKALSLAERYRVVIEIAGNGRAAGTLIGNEPSASSESVLARQLTQGVTSVTHHRERTSSLANTNSNGSMSTGMSSVHCRP